MKAIDRANSIVCCALTSSDYSLSLTVPACAAACCLTDFLWTPSVTDSLLMFMLLLLSFYYNLLSSTVPQHWLCGPVVFVSCVSMYSCQCVTVLVLSVNATISTIETISVGLLPSWLVIWKCFILFYLRGNWPKPSYITLDSGCLYSMCSYVPSKVDQ